MNANFNLSKRIFNLKYAPYAAGLFLVVSGLLLFGSAGRDDAHITYWSAHALANFGEIVNYNGERVEQSSSLLQVLLLAFFGKLTGLNIVTLGKLSSILFGFLSVVLTGIFVSKISKPAYGAFAALLVSSYPYFVYWSYGGLESTLVSCTGLLVIITFSEFIKNSGRLRFLYAALAMFAFLLVRPETPILLVCLLSAGLGIVFLKWRFRGNIAPEIFVNLFKLFGMYLLILAFIFSFRLWYFESLFPQPVTAKAGSIDTETLSIGVEYLTGNLWYVDWGTALLSLVMLAAAVVILVESIRADELNFYTTFSLLYIAGYAAFVVLTGGDWMEGGRFLINFLPIALAMIPLAIFYFFPPNPKHLLLLALLLFTVEVNALIAFTKKYSTGVPLWAQVSFRRSYNSSQYSWFEHHSRVNMRDVYLIDYLNYLVREVSEIHKPVTIMSAQMGVVPYHVAMRHYGNVRFLDRARLIDRTYSSCPILNPSYLSLGERASYHYYFENLTSILQTCDVVEPDIIFDTVVSDLTRELLMENKYTLIYSQVGSIRSNDTWLEGYEVKAFQIMGIRSDLLELLDIKPVFLRLGE